MTLFRLLPSSLAVLMLAACATASQDPPALPAPQEAFWDALSSHCGPDGEGRAYEGRLVSADARDADLQGRAMIAHWAECTPDRIAIAFHIADADAPDGSGGWDRSRTWLVTRTPLNESGTGLRLKHDHRHEDGSADAVTHYGGDTLSAGTARVQDFPVDAYSIALFGREGLDASLTNVWRLEVDPARRPGARFAYQLTRRNDPTRLFRAEFDASDEMAAPPAAWGWE